MAQNTLKQKAREFARAHGVSYLTALKAVDEPFHELRDLIYSVQRNSDSLQQHFRLIGDQGRFSAAYPAPDLPERLVYGEYAWNRSHLRGILTEVNLPRLSQSEFFIELGRRTERLQRSETGDVWVYRELHRAGLVDQNEPQLEPIFHHYYTKVSASWEPLLFSGPRLGIFGVNMSEYSQIRDPYYLIPVTVDQLTAFRLGEPLSSPVEFSLNHPPQDGAKDLRWKQSYVAAYEYYGRDTGNEGPTLRLLLKSPVANLAAELQELGLDFDDFQEDEGFTLGVELDHRLMRDMADIRSHDHTRWIATPGLIVLG